MDSRGILLWQKANINELDVQAKGGGKGGGFASLVVPKTRVMLGMWQVRCVQCEE